MIMKTYIKIDVPKYYIEFAEEIDAQYWEGNIGTTYQDFLNGKWVLLSEAQLTFKEEHPNASVKEVLDMEISPVHIRTLQEAKQEKMQAITEYDFSENVNSFYIVNNGQTITAWINSEQRANYKNSLDSAEMLGLEEVHPIFNGVQLTIPTSTAKLALAQIQIYADRCFIVTETHKANVNSLDTIEAVDSYNNETGYPEKLTFTL